MHLTIWPRLGLAAGIGIITGLGFAPFNWWPLTILGVTGWALLFGGLRPRAAAGAGYIFGLAFFGFTVSWVWVLGWWVAALMVAFLAGWFALLGLMTPILRKVPGWPVWLAFAWVGIEFLSARIPFGGFAWSRLSFTTADQPLAGYLWLIGAPGVSALVALTGTTLAALASPTAAKSRRVMAALLLAVLFLGGAVLKAVPVADGGPTVAVGMVQGNVDGTAGARAMGYARSVTNNHMSETITLLARARAGLDTMPDFVLWPENASDMDPTADAIAGYLAETSAQLSDMPILIGAVMDGPGEGERQTSALWWEPGVGVTDRLDKVNLVPFGEFTPMRDLVFALAPMAKMVGNQSVAGTGPRTLEVTLPDGRALVIGNSICYELAFDDTVYGTVRDGGQIITVQSNNATYTGTAQPRQQFQITRIRAMELRREIVVSTTSSFSGLIDAQGRVLSRTEEGTSASRTYLVPQRSGLTPAVQIAGGLSIVISLMALAAVVFGLMRSRRSD